MYVAAAFISGVTMGGAALAQNEPRALEEVIVTAQKRTERLQDVPISIAAITAEEIERRGLVSAEDYLRGMPAVNHVQNQFGGVIIIRGLETSMSGQNFSTGNAVATYFGETPTTASAAVTGNSTVDLKLVDIERVEVLRGPQGTAFGSAALGGAVRTIPMKPKLDSFEGNVSTAYSVTSGTGDDNYGVQAVVNLPLAKDRFAIRAVGYQFVDSGYIHNVAGSDPAFQAYSAGWGAQQFAVDNDDIGGTNFTGGRIAALFKASEDLQVTLSYLTQKTELDGWGHVGTDGLATESSATLGTYEQAIWQVAPEQVVRGERNGVFDTDIDIANAALEYDLGWGSILATFSHVESSSITVVPFDIGVPFSQRGVGDHREHTGEVRLTTDLDGDWNFLAGVYAEELDDRARFDYYWYGTPSLNIFGPPNYIGDYLDRRNLKQKAAFAEVTWQFMPTLSLTTGARAYDYERTSQVDTTGSLFGNSSVPTDADKSGTNFRANLSYKPNEDVHVYAAWAEGFRLGKPQPGLAPGACDRNGDGIVDGTSNVTIASTRLLNSDSVDSYELGAKFAVLDRRLSIAADVYRIDWDRVPLTIIAPSIAQGGCGNLYTANAGGARSEGIELQATWHMTQALRMDVGASTIRAELTEDVPNLPVPAFEGDRLPGSPELTANLGLQYDFTIGIYDAYVRTDSIYVDTFYSDLQALSRTRSGGYMKVDAAARIALDNFNIEVFVRNLTDADDFTFRGPGDYGENYGYRLRPRTIGLQLGYSF
jgi:outer membrane receptor protein involved in Fe transport